MECNEAFAVKTRLSLKNLKNRRAKTWRLQENGNPLGGAISYGRNPTALPRGQSLHVHHASINPDRWEIRILQLPAAAADWLSPRFFFFAEIIQDISKRASPGYYSDSGLYSENSSGDSLSPVELPLVTGSATFGIKVRRSLAENY